MTDEAHPRVSLYALARVALWAGLIGFGGGFAVMATLRRVVVDEHRWISAEEFVQRVGVAGALPGTIAANLVTLVGQRIRGLAGGIVAPTVFITPGCAIIAVLAAYYDRLHGTLVVRAALDGMNPAVAGLFAAITVELGRESLKTRGAWVVALFAAVALSLHWLTLLEVIGIAGAVGVLAARPKDGPPAAALVVVAAPVALAPAAPSLGSVLGVFARIGVATFGGGIAMVPALAREAVGRGWIDERTFMDAVALGQVTPGPIGVSATFIGWRVAGPLGAAMATAGVFAPPIAIALVVGRSLSAFRANPHVRAFLEGVAPAVVGVIAAAALSVGVPSVHGWVDGAVAVAACALRVARPKWSPVWVLAGGAAAGILRAALARAA